MILDGPFPSPGDRVHVWTMPNRVVGMTGTVSSGGPEPLPHLVLTDVQESAATEVVVILGPGVVIEQSTW